MKESSVGSYVDESPSVSLTDAHVARFGEQGFLELDRLISEAEVVALQGVYDHLFEPGTAIAGRDRIELAADGDGGPSLPQILNPDHYAPELFQTAAFRNASDIARQILGDSVQYIGIHAIRKPPHHGACGATIHAGRTLHYAGPNRSGEARRALIMAFRAPPVPVGAPRAFPWQRPEWHE